MLSARVLGLACCAWLLASLTLCAAGVPPVASPAQESMRLAERIDQLIAAGWSRERIEPAPLASDSEFLRRVYLDIAGRIPSVTEARSFLRDRRKDKQARLIDKLLAGPGYINHFTNVWRYRLLPGSETSFQVRANAPLLESWLRQQLSDNVPYDRMVRALLTYSFDPNRGGVPFREDVKNGIQAFYFANEGKAENLGASTARLFLGASLECAQCHDHPFARWKREQFWEHASFFAGLDSQSRDGFVQIMGETKDRRELAISGGKRVVQASFLDGKEPRWKYGIGPRETLADWMTAADNPYFARAAVNWLWAHFFGVGLVEPVQDLRPENLASHPELLDELARAFSRRFDIKLLIRAMTLSKTYQRTSQGKPGAGETPRLFARMNLKGLSPEQLFDSLAQATGFREARIPGFLILEEVTLREKFRMQFLSQDKPTEFQTSTLQALVLMNGKLTQKVTTPKRSAVLGAVVDAPFLNTRQKVETLYLAALSRWPRPEEAERFTEYVKNGGARGDGKSALGDVFWVLLNSPEFILNH